MRTFLSLLLILVFSSSTWARYCNSPNCSMCNRLFGPITTTTTVKVEKQDVKQAEKKKIVVQATSKRGIRLFLERFKPTRSDIVVDLGCGDGRVLIEASKKTGCRGIGVEIQPKVAQLAVKRVREARLSNRIKIYVGDASSPDIQPLYWSATYIYTYQFPPVLRKLLPVLPRDATCISYLHPWPGKRQRKVVVEDQEYFILMGD